MTANSIIERPNGQLICTDIKELDFFYHSFIVCDCMISDGEGNYYPIKEEN